MNAKRNDPSQTDLTAETARQPPQKPRNGRRPAGLPLARIPRITLFVLSVAALLLLYLWGVRHRMPSGPSDSARQFLAAPGPADSRLREARILSRDKARVADLNAKAPEAVMRELATSAPQPPPKAQGTEFSPAPMIARSVSLSLLTKDLAGARMMMDKILVRHGGYAAELTVNSERQNSPSLEATLRIPAAELGGALAELKSLGRIQTESQKGEDVSTQHSDLVARLQNARETEQRLQSILRERTGKMSDVLEVEQEISRVRGEIEQLEADQQALEHRVTFATVDLRIDEEFRAELGTPSFLNRLRNAVVSGFQGAADSLAAILFFCLSYGPSILLWFVILFLPARFLWRRSRGFVFRERAEGIGKS